MSDSERRQRTISSTPRLTPDEVSARSFPTAFRGISETDVRAFLKRVAEDLTAARNREHELMTTIDELEARLRTPRPLDETELLDALGEETTRLLRSAREAAADIRGKAEERASRLVHDAAEQADRVRKEADEILGVKTGEAEAVAQGLLEEAEQRATDLMRVADERAVEERATAERYAEELRARVDREATNEIETARARGIALLEEAASLRERVIDDLGRRRELLSGQLEELRTGRDELLDAYRVVKRTFLEATEALAQVEARATAGRVLPGGDPTDLAAAKASESEAAHAAGLEAGTATPALEPLESPESSESSEPSESLESSDGPAEAAPTTEPSEAAAEPAATEPVPEEPAAASEPTGDDASPNLADVDDLFARLRAGAHADTAPDHEAAVPSGGAEPAAAADAPAATGSVTPAPVAVAPASPAPKRDATGGANGNEPDADEAPEWLTQRDSALAPMRVKLVRQVKLAIGNEQNEVLDKVRRHKGRPVAANVLPDLEAQTEAWAAVIATATADAYRLAGPGSGDDSSGAGVEIPADLAPGLARALVEPLRERLTATIDAEHEPGETTAQVAERIGARYREWKNRSAESSTEDALVAAYARGVYDRAVDGAVLTWSVPPGGCCVDCSDNALEPTRKGHDFPTGQAYPPAHPGCRCVLGSEAPDVDLSDGTANVGVESTTPG